MTREERTVFLALLTLLVYTGILYMEHGVVLFPFPLNEFIFLFVALPFSIWNWKKYPFQIALILIAGILNVLSTQFFWTFFLDTVQMEKMLEGISQDLFKISYTLSLTLFACVYFLRSGFKQKYFCFLLALIGFPLSIILNSSILELFLLILFASIGTAKKINSPLHLLWILLASLQLMKILTLSL